MDHPRLRGEHTKGTAAPLRDTGSSPPTRGTLVFSCCWLLCNRIIPAYAGNTKPLFDQTVTVEDHPRLRGEHHTGYL